MNMLNNLKDDGGNVFKTIYSKLTINNLVKYIVQGIIVAIAAYVIPRRTKNIREVLIIATVAALTFFTLDIFTDDENLSMGAQLGAGLAIGLRLVTDTPLKMFL